MAEGTRGRRWRATATADGHLTHVLLLELDNDGRPSRLELTTEAGMLTLHPEPDGRSIEGNVVHARGVRPLQFRWSPDHELEIVDRPIATSVMLHRLSGSVRVGEGETIDILSIDAALTVRPGSRVVRRIADARWEVADLSAGTQSTIELGAHGIPRFRDAQEWPLEP